MSNTVKTVDLNCPYRKTRFVHLVPFNKIEERFDFQFAENGSIEIVSTGKFDLLKEVESHKGEVGLINVLKLAEGRGISLDTFAKTEPGLGVAVPNIETFDDLVKAKNQADEKLAGIAAQFGLTTDQLVAAVKAGDKLTPVSDKKSVPESEVKE